MYSLVRCITIPSVKEIGLQVPKRKPILSIFLSTSPKLHSHPWILIMHKRLVWVWADLQVMAPYQIQSKSTERFARKRVHNFLHSKTTVTLIESQAIHTGIKLNSLSASIIIPCSKKLICKCQNASQCKILWVMKITKVRFFPLNIRHKMSKRFYWSNKSQQHAKFYLFVTLGDDWHRSFFLSCISMSLVT